MWPKLYTSGNLSTRCSEAQAEPFMPKPWSQALQVLYSWESLTVWWLHSLWPLGRCRRLQDITPQMESGCIKNDFPILGTSHADGLWDVIPTSWIVPFLHPPGNWQPMWLLPYLPTPSTGRENIILGPGLEVAHCSLPWTPIAVHLCPQREILCLGNTWSLF